VDFDRDHGLAKNESLKAPTYSFDLGQFGHVPLLLRFAATTHGLA
jgi:hypothetical protein